MGALIIIMIWTFRFWDITLGNCKGFKWERRLLGVDKK